MPAAGLVHGARAGAPGSRGPLAGSLRARSASQPNSLIMSRQTRRTSMIVERNGRSQALARVLAWHRFSARTATAQRPGLTVLCDERGARYHGKGLIADEPSHLRMRRLSRRAAARKR